MSLRERLLWIEFSILLVLQIVAAAAAWGRDVPIVPRGQRFTCTAIAVWDGDGPIWCREGPRVRLARINARELDGSCRPHAPCVAASGIAAREHLVALLGGVISRSADGHILIRPRPLLCRSDGSGRGVRTAAWCTLDGVDLSRSMIRDRFAAPWRDPHPS